MSANVQCAGCGWKGERYTRGPYISTGDGTPERPLRPDLQAMWAQDFQLRTKKPCPRCGGQVKPYPDGVDW